MSRSSELRKRINELEEIVVDNKNNVGVLKKGARVMDEILFRLQDEIKEIKKEVKGLNELYTELFDFSKYLIDKYEELEKKMKLLDENVTSISKEVIGEELESIKNV